MAARKSSAKDRPSYRCAECGWQTAKWLGRCPECQAWGTVDEVGGAPGVRTTAPGRVSPPRPRSARSTARQATARRTGVPELDRVLGGGLVPGRGGAGRGRARRGQVDAAAGRGGEGVRARQHRTLYVTGEESASQVRLRADRIGALGDHLYLAAETDLAAVLGAPRRGEAALLVLDSVQTVASPETRRRAGRGGTGARGRRAPSSAPPRSAASPRCSSATSPRTARSPGPRLLEHLVDVVLHFEGDRHARLRLVRGVKNRYGATDEVGCFELHDEGITGLADPSGLFLTRRAEPVPGTCLTVTLEGRRPLVAEVQALTVDSQIPSPRRTTSGPGDLPGLDDAGRARTARPDQRPRQARHLQRDGRRRELTEPAADLAVALALASAASDTPLPKNLVAIGEVGLAGEVRRVTGVQRRLAEAARLGFTHALVPADPGRIPAGMRVPRGRGHRGGAARAARSGAAAEAPQVDWSARRRRQRSTGQPREPPVRLPGPARRTQDRRSAVAANDRAAAPGRTGGGYPVPTA